MKIIWFNKFYFICMINQLLDYVTLLQLSDYIMANQDRILKVNLTYKLLLYAFILGFSLI